MVSEAALQWRENGSLLGVNLDEVVEIGIEPNCDYTQQRTDTTIAK
jgi:hypothetical protein